MKEKAVFILNQTTRKMLSNLCNKNMLKRQLPSYLLEKINVHIILRFISVFHKGRKITEFEVEGVSSKIY
jgi:hypothetical protein